MFKIIVLIVCVLLVAALIYASTKPNVFSVVRKLHINAVPESVFAEINDFNRWESWSPWEKKDSLMQRAYSGAASGVGAVYAWNGNKHVGQGRMEIMESTPAQKIIIKLDFFKPFEAHNVAEFSFLQDGEGALVMWEMHGPQPFIAKFMCIFMNMDKMVGTDFELGLASLKALVETNDN